MQVIWEDDSAKTAAAPGYRLEQVPGHVMDMGNHDQIYPSPAGTRPVFWDEQNGVAYEGGAGQYHTDAITEHPELKARFGYDTIHSPPPGIYMGRKQMFTSPTVAWYRRPKDEHIQGVHDTLGAQEEQEDDYDWSDQTPSESPTPQLPSPI